MQVKTCRVGGVLRLGDDTRIVIHRRQAQWVCLGVTASAGTQLVLGGASLRPIEGALGTWRYLFSLHTIRRFALGAFDVRVWLPGEIVPLARDCQDWLHVGVTVRPSSTGKAEASLVDSNVVSPLSTLPAPPPSRTACPCLPIRRSA